MDFIKNSVPKVIVLKLISITYRANQALHGLERKLNSSSNRNTTLQALEDIGNDANKFKRIAKEKSLKISSNDSELENAVYLYFLTKQAASIYEAKIQYLPLQVYNEMRNALDHYFRAIVSDNSSARTSHIGKMEGHLQRAFLDVIKLTCAASMELVDKTHNRIGEKPLGLVDSGEYIKKFTELKVNAEDALIKAKLSEYTLGDGGESSVLNNYIEAFEIHNLTYSFHKQNLWKIKWGRVKWLCVRPMPILLAFLIGLAGSSSGGYLSKLAWSATENLPFVQHIKEYVEHKSIPEK